jgi:hypothetical protein
LHFSAAQKVQDELGSQQGIESSCSERPIQLEAQQTARRIKAGYG